MRAALSTVNLPHTQFAMSILLKVPIFGRDVNSQIWYEFHRHLWLRCSPARERICGLASKTHFSGLKPLCLSSLKPEFLTGMQIPGFGISTHYVRLDKGRDYSALKAKALLQHYEAGRRDFRGENLRGQSFKGQDLSEADFSGADIRGANFSGATLIEANFSQAKAGLQQRWTATLVVISWLLAAVSGPFAASVGHVLALICDPKNLQNNVVASLVSSVALAIFVGVTLRKGIGAGLIAAIFTTAITIAVTFAVDLDFAFAVASNTAGAVGFCYRWRICCRCYCWFCCRWRYLCYGC